MKRNSSENSKLFVQGIKDGIPIALAYFAVSFPLGISASLAGLSAFQGFIASFFTAASAGEYAAFQVILENSGYIEMFLMTLVASARYFLMSVALSQRLSKDEGIFHRLLLGFYVTDELFAITIAREGKIRPLYTYGADAIAIPSWAIGTALGIVVGNTFPAYIVNALGMAIFGMFISIVVPKAKGDRNVFIVVLASYILSFAFNSLKVFSNLSSGSKIIILTIAISSVAALLFPVKEDAYE